MHIIYTYLHFFLSKTFIIHFKILISFPYKCTEKKEQEILDRRIICDWSTDSILINKYTEMKLISS